MPNVGVGAGARRANGVPPSMLQCQKSTSGKDEIGRDRQHGGDALERPGPTGMREQQREDERRADEDEMRGAQDEFGVRSIVHGRESELPRLA